MSADRLALALDAGLLILPAEGRIAVFSPRAGMDLGVLPKPRVHVVQSFRPDHDAFAAQGYAVDPEAVPPYGAAVVRVPRAKAAARALIAEAAALVPEGAPVAVDGAKTDGIDSLLRDCRRLAPVGEPIAKAHGKIFVIASPGAEPFAHWAAVPRRLPEGWLTPPGGFSADGIDPGSALLAAALPAGLAGRGADLGAGWGYLAAEALRRPGVSEMHLIEAERRALDCARLNAADPRARFHWADARLFRPEAPFDFIISNPPFHVERAADPALGAAFIRTAGRMLAPGGSFWMVANRHLPYEAPLAAAFREVEELPASGDSRPGGYKIVRAARPFPPPRR